MPEPDIPEAGRDRIFMRADPAWISHVVAVAEQHCLDLAGYIRLAVNNQLRRDGFPPPGEAIGKAGEPAPSPHTTAKKHRGRTRGGA
jgi:hypothetical protein